MAGVPYKPGPWWPQDVNNTSVYGTCGGMPYTNGGAIDQFQVYASPFSTMDGTHPTTGPQPVSKYLGTVTTGTVTGLVPGTNYYFWARAHNSYGWSAWSDRTNAKTQDVPPAPTRPGVDDVRQRSMHAFFIGNGDGGSKILEWQIGYSPYDWTTYPKTYVSGYDKVLTGLTPGQLYTIRGRGRNEWGWGPWSPSLQWRAAAGAYVYTYGKPIPAIPYVRVNGVWKIAEMKIKIQGLWEGTG